MYVVTISTQGTLTSIYTSRAYRIFLDKTLKLKETICNSDKRNLENSSFVNGEVRHCLLELCTKRTI